MRKITESEQSRYAGARGHQDTTETEALGFPSIPRFLSRRRALKSSARILASTVSRLPASSQQRRAGVRGVLQAVVRALPA